VALPGVGRESPDGGLNVRGPAVDYLHTVCSIRDVLGRWTVIRSLRARAVSLDPAAEAGQTMAEYATLLAVLIIAVATMMTVFSTAVNNALGSHITTILTGI
jgi:Flp pilus assembly pilin Flp